MDEESIFKLMKKALTDYPIGTKYRMKNLNDVRIVKGTLKYYQLTTSTGKIITDGWGGHVYENNVWSEIVEKKTLKINLNFKTKN